jgi:hypothetical protein
MSELRRLIIVGNTMFGLDASHTVSRLLPENHSGRVALSDLLRRNDLTLSDEAVVGIVSLSVHHARKLARYAKKDGNSDLLDWRTNLVRSFDSIILAIVKAKAGHVLDAPLYCQQVNEILLESGAVFDASEIKAAIATPIRCEEHHDNGRFTARVLESEYVTLGCMSLLTDSRSDNAYLCRVCARPIAVNRGGKDWFVCIGDEWVG